MIAATLDWVDYEKDDTYVGSTNAIVTKSSAFTLNCFFLFSSSQITLHNFIESHYIRQFNKVICTHLWNVGEFHFHISDDVAISRNLCHNYIQMRSALSIIYSWHIINLSISVPFHKRLNFKYQHAKT